MLEGKRQSRQYFFKKIRCARKESKVYLEKAKKKKKVVYLCTLFLILLQMFLVVDASSTSVTSTFTYFFFSYFFVGLFWFSQVAVLLGFTQERAHIDKKRILHFPLHFVVTRFEPHERSILIQITESGKFTRINVREKKKRKEKFLFIYFNRG